MLSDGRHTQTLGDNTTVNANVGYMEDKMTTTLLTNCPNCDTHSREFWQVSWSTNDPFDYLYECPTCSETLWGSELLNEPKRP